MGSNCVKPKAKVSVVPAAVTHSRNVSELHQVSAQVKWKQGELIGQGAYGQVYECLDVDTGQLYALKHVALSGKPEKIQKAVSNLKREIMTLSELHHKNIVKYIQAEIAEDQSGVNIILEYVPGGSVRQLLNKFHKFSEPMARNYLKQLLEGLNFLHTRGIIHRDVKCANLLAGTDGNIKITDFGASKRLGSSHVNEDYEVCKSLKGSPYWMAPEVARRSGHSYPADIWSVGCTLIEMLTSKPPWSDVSSNVKEVLAMIASATTAPNYPPDCSPECYSFLDNCLQVNPTTRATAEQLLQHCFITGLKLPGKKLQRLLSATIKSRKLPRPKEEPEDGVQVVAPRVPAKRNSVGEAREDLGKRTQMTTVLLTREEDPTAIEKFRTNEV